MFSEAAIHAQDSGLSFDQRAWIFIVKINTCMKNREKYKSEYQAIVNARSRCANPLAIDYHNYGGRGITVDPSWCGKGGFDRFFAHIGAKPDPDLTLDRIDNDKGYVPGNVRWATRQVQFRNRRPKTRGLEYTRQQQERNAKIVALHDEGVKVQVIARIYDLSSIWIYRIIRAAK
ncbi:hypothetical protein WSK_3141 [Novosphingobium sp. Rr 2-17]|uniref:helix-turn-helix domain-containing protein n=1 Tax=Novosphingobium sp. Rr 2-17 TaxID=555793 RepID=UPI0002698232|nr:helix-turn-helix domain-containing protein [Novosphingobium sp. Rr 2-17]EIZ78259.1 hypothetical protein WSK_3141 [Novosphingobium sp. Rr 2-17]